MPSLWFTLGIDPGATGAMALMSEGGTVAEVWDYPGSPVELWNLLSGIPQRTFDIRLIILEKVSSMPKQGVASTFKFGTNFGIWQMACASMERPFELITPQRWRKILDSSVPARPTKEDLRQYTLRKWPHARDWLGRMKDHNRAEAILIAEYARQKCLGIIR